MAISLRAEHLQKLFEVILRGRFVSLLTQELVSSVHGEESGA